MTVRPGTGNCSASAGTAVRWRRSGPGIKTNHVHGQNVGRRSPSAGSMEFDRPSLRGPFDIPGGDGSRVSSRSARLQRAFRHDGPRGETKVSKGAALRRGGSPTPPMAGICGVPMAAIWPGKWGGGRREETGLHARLVSSTVQPATNASTATAKTIQQASNTAHLTPNLGSDSHSTGVAWSYAMKKGPLIPLPPRHVAPWPRSLPRATPRQDRQGLGRLIFGCRG